MRITHLSGHQRAIAQNGQNAQFSGKSNFFHLSPDLSGMVTGPNRPPWDPFRSPKLPVSTPDCGRYHRGTVGACATLEYNMSLFQLPGGSITLYNAPYHNISIPFNNNLPIGRKNSHRSGEISPKLFISNMTS